MVLRFLPETQTTPCEVSAGNADDTITWSKVFFALTRCTDEAQQHCQGFDAKLYKTKYDALADKLNTASSRNITQVLDFQAKFLYHKMQSYLSGLLLIS